MLSSKSPPSITSKPRSSVHPHSHLRPLNRLLKKVNQLIHNTLRRIDRGNHERIWIHRAQVKIAPKAANPLCKKDPLCSAVAFPEWMQHIDRVVKVRYLFRQLTMGQSLAAEISQALEARISARFDLHGGNKSGSFLRNVDRAYLPSPVIKIAEQESVDAFVVLKVKATRKRLLIQQTRLAQNDSGLCVCQFRLILDAQLV